ncbi:ABC transporter (iron.B12.siderophore.hemin) permease component [Candidatus Sodalis pierantonius str. SOPE]|uniref:ABC transporter (Iron.B12.siderophore.hemin) permease component n=1 Tax=Candidatus Sodalis pierantonii str. SOPE TaxID=2342 RepID=W0HND9_9GAMM|nr:iron ABC transporter permease [Candidatus Sodalis pierantonius]AHF73715.1 ABC transporter (iron.B12.siderophore.hemin) permease component [Candidatus Sodalis pierantonius str. SOPE]
MITSRLGYAVLLCLMALLVAGLMIAGIIAGTVTLPVQQVMAALTGREAWVPEMVARIVIDLRLPRSVLAAGAGLAMVGAYLQTATRNALADPFLFGLSSGASAGAVLIITRLGDSLGQWSLPLAVFAGGITSALAVICGLAISFLFGSFTHYLVFSGDQRAAGALLFWTLGGLGLARWDNLPFTLLPLVMLFGLLNLRWRSLDALLAGETMALSLGVAVIRLRMEIFLVCALATSLLVALTGVIGFVGLMIPHLARPLCGIRHRRVLPLCALLGAALLCGGDLLSRLLIAPQELPIGIITAGLGGFFVLSLLLRGHRPG